MADETVLPLMDKLQQHFASRSKELGISRDYSQSLFQDLLPAEGEEIQLPTIDLAEAKGKSFIIGLLQSGDFWSGRVEDVINKLINQPGNAPKVRLLGEIKNSIRAVVPQELEARTEQGEVADLASGIREYIGDRVLARATDPQELLTNKTRLDELYTEEEARVRRTLNLTNRSSELYQASMTSLDRYTKGTEQYIEKKRERQRTYSSVLSARFLQGLPIEASVKDSNGSSRGERVTKPAYIDEQLSERYAFLLEGSITQLDASLAITPEQYAAMQKGKTYSEPIEDSHEQYMGRLFTAIQANETPQAEAELRKLSSSLIEKPQVESYARGLALRTLATAGNLDTYLLAVSHLGNERPQLAALARQYWETLPPESEDRKKVAKLLLIAHQGELKGAGALIEAVGGQSTLIELQKEAVEEMMKTARAQVDSVSLNISLETGKIQPRTVEGLVREITSTSNENDKRRLAGELASQVMFQQAVRRISESYLTDKVADYESGSGSIFDIFNKSQDLTTALSHLNLLQVGNRQEKITLGTDQMYSAYGNGTTVYEVPDSLRPFVYEANFAAQLLNKKPRELYENRTILGTMGQFFDQAGEFGVDKKALIETHNQLALSAAAAKDLLEKTFGSDQYRSPVIFHDVLMKLGSEKTGAYGDIYTHTPGFKSYQEERSSLISDGYWVYNSSVGEYDSMSRYIRAEHNRELTEQVVSELRPLVAIQGTLSAAHETLVGEQATRLPNFLESQKSATRDMYGPRFEDHPEVKAATEKSAELLRSLGEIDTELQALGPIYNQRSDIQYNLDRWQAPQGMMETAQFKMGRGPAAEQRRKIEAELLQYTGEAIDITKTNANEVRNKLEHARDEKKAAIIQVIKTKIMALAEQAGTPEDRVAAFLDRHTVTKTNDSGEKVVVSIKVPEKSEDKKITTEVEYNLETHDFNLSSSRPGYELRPLFLLMHQQEEALSQPVTNALSKILNQGSLIGESNTLSEATNQLRENLGRSNSANEVLAKQLQNIISGAMQKRADAIDPDEIDTQLTNSTLSPDLQAALKTQVEVIRKAQERRRRTE